MFTKVAAFAFGMTVISFGNVWAQTDSTASSTSPRDSAYELHRLDPTRPLIDRMGTTPESVLQILRDAEMSPVAYELNDQDRQNVADAISILPPLHRKVLQQRLRSISFVNNMPNTALTSTVNPSEAYPLFDITIRAEILEQSASEWVAEKEGSCFEWQGSTNLVEPRPAAEVPAPDAIRLTADVGTVTAIQYVLLHEATHIVDATNEITPSLQAAEGEVARNDETPFTGGVWADHTTPVRQYQDPDLMSIRFRRTGTVLKAEKATEVYLALSKTPFVSLYGSCARTEDLAEYVTVYHLTQELNQPFRITIQAGANILLSHEPMKSELTRRRMDFMKQFYDDAVDEPTSVAK